MAKEMEERRAQRTKVMLDLREELDRKVEAGIMTQAAATREYEEEVAKLDAAGRRSSVLVGSSQLPGKNQRMTRSNPFVSSQENLSMGERSGVDACYGGLRFDPSYVIDVRELPVDGHSLANGSYSAWVIETLSKKAEHEGGYTRKDGTRGKGYTMQGAVSKKENETLFGSLFRP